MSKVNPKKFSAALKRGSSLSDAMVYAGYSPAVAKRGKASLSKECKAELEIATKKMFARAQKISEKTSDDQLRHAVRGGLIQNLAERCDKGIQSLKVAGSLRELNMFQPDSVQGIVIIEQPANLPPLPPAVAQQFGLSTAPTLDAPALPESVSNDGLDRGRFFSSLPEDQAWRNSEQGQAARKRLESKGLL